MIFFISYSKLATNPDRNMVTVERNINRALEVRVIHSENRIKRYTPAVTRVEECTNAETGVGAAIAAGSQAEKGNWALFVIAAKTTKTERVLVSVSIQSVIVQGTKEKSPKAPIQAIIKRIQMSPTRLLITVSIPALLDFLVG